MADITILSTGKRTYAVRSSTQQPNGNDLIRYHGPLPDKAAATTWANGRFRNAPADSWRVIILEEAD